MRNPTVCDDRNCWSIWFRAAQDMGYRYERNFLHATRKIDPAPTLRNFSRNAR
jgi:hypothetical protein